MKNTFRFLAIATALIAISCGQENLVESPASKGEVSIQLFCTDLATRAAGDDAYNENKIDHFDYFFFSDAEGTTPLYPHARVSGETATFATDEGEAFEDLSQGAYVYVVANYPGQIPATVTTLAEVLALPVTTDFQADIKATPKPNPNGFIMDNLNADGTITHFQAAKPREETVVKIGLSRLAVKTTLVINVEKEVAGVGTEKWTPVIDAEHLFIYFVNADKTNTMAGTAMRRADEPEGADPKDYFTYETTHPYTDNGEVDGKYQIVTAPSYTYPQKWNTGDNGEPYYKIQMGWQSSVTGMSPFYYKIPIPVSATENVFTLNRNTWYQLTLDVKVLGGTEDEYITLDQNYCVADFADWSSPSDAFGTSNDSAHYFDVPTLTYNHYSSNPLDILFVTEASAAAKITSIEYYDYSGTSVQGDLVSRSPSDDPALTFTYSHPVENRDYKLTVDEENKVVTFEHNISNLYVLRTVKIRIYKYVTDEEGNQAIEPNIYRDVTIYQHPPIELKKDAAGNVFVNGYFARVENAPAATRSGSFTSGGTTYYYSRGGANNSWNETNYITGGENGTNGYGSVTDGRGNYSGGISTSFYTTDIKVTAFNSTNDHYTANGETVYYMIGDPRKKASEVYPNVTNWNNWLHNYLANNTANGTWTNAGNILICSQSEADRNVIAPRFLISSALNAMVSNTTQQVTFANAVKRAATYQEMGYPAGRWRLPTEAEIAFIIARQNDGTLPILYAANSDYWAGSGRLAQTGSAGNTNITFSNASATTTQSCRFVYDLWYWGETKQSTNVYHANQHN